MKKTYLKKVSVVSIVVLSCVLTLGGTNVYQNTPIPPKLITHVVKLKVTIPIPPKFIKDEYLSYLSKTCKDNNVPLLLVYKLIQKESTWRQSAIHHNLDAWDRKLSEDVGMFQLNSKYHKWLVKSFGRPYHHYRLYSSSYDNTEIGVKYLASLFNYYHNWKLAVMAFNCGPTKVDAKLASQRTIDYANEIVPYTEWWNNNEQIELLPYVTN